MCGDLNELFGCVCLYHGVDYNGMDGIVNRVGWIVAQIQRKFVVYMPVGKLCIRLWITCG